MNLEFIEDGPSGEALLLLYGGGPGEVASLRSALHGLSQDVGLELAVHDLPFVLTVGNCRLRAISAAKDVGVRTRSPADFEWTLDQESWLQVDDLLEPFCRETKEVRFQFLNPGRGTRIIYSTTRAW
ncbi:MAG: hypothetical protein ACREOU_09315 [Candidatus Eiseniibacteriota bacterium]